MVPFMVMMLVATYVVGARLANRRFGVAVAFVSGFLPVVVAEFGQISTDLAMAAAAMVAVTLALRQKMAAAMVVLSIAVLINGAAVILLPMFYWWEKRPNRWLLLPAATLLVWFFYHYSVTGWWLAPTEGVRFLPPNILTGVIYAWYVVRGIATSGLMWLVTIPAVAAGGLLWWQKAELDEDKLRMITGMGLSIVVGIVYWGMRGGFSLERAMVVVPLVVIVSLWLIERAIEMVVGDANWIMVVVTVVVAIAVMSQWRPREAPTQGLALMQAANLGYQDQILVHRQAGAFLEIYYPRAKIYGGFPEALFLTEPYMGYVSRALDFSLCDEYDENEDGQQLVMVHPYHESQIACGSILAKRQFKQEAQFESNGRWVQVYSVEASGSAQATQGGTN
jgi:4-amino-4-deoxy-L-arabinose transferase-like glycosyltransferase